MWTVNNFTAQGGGGGDSVFPISVNGTEDEIDVDQYSSGGVKYFVVGLAQAIKNSLTSLASSVTYLASGLAGKKDRQDAKNFLGSSTKTITGLSQDANGELAVTFGDIERQIVYVTTSTPYDDVKAIFDAGNLPVLQESDNQYYPTHKDAVTVGDETAYAYMFMAFPREILYIGSDGEIRFSLYQCHPTDGWTLLKNDAIYNKTNVDNQLAKKQEQRGWVDFMKSYNDSSPDTAPHYVKICEINTSFALMNYGYRMAATEFDIAVTNTGFNGENGTSAHFALSMTIGAGNLYRFYGNWTACKNSYAYSNWLDRIDVILAADKSKAEVYLVLKQFNFATSGHIGATVNAGFQNLTYRVDGLGTCWTYRNARVNVSTTAPDTTGATVTSFNCSLDTSTYCCDVGLLGTSYASGIYTEFDRSWAARKPIFVYDDTPPVGFPSAKYFITHRNGDTFYGLSCDPTNNINSITLTYNAGTWTITRNLGLVNTAIENKILTIYQATINSGTDDEKDALNEKMSEVAYNGGIIIFYSNNNEAYILTQFSSNEYNFTLSQNASSTSFNSDTFNIQYSTATHSFSATEHSLNIDQNDVIYRIDGNNNWIFANAANFCNHLDDAIDAKRPIEYFYTSGSVTDHYVYSDRLVGTGYKTYTFQRTYKSSASLLIVETVELKYDSVLDNLSKTVTKCGVSYTVVT